MWTGALQSVGGHALITQSDVAGMPWFTAYARDLSRNHNNNSEFFDCGYTEAQ